MEQYKTADLGLASALIAKGYKLTTIEANDVRRAVFGFTGEDNIPLSVDRYYAKNLPVDAFTYSQILRDLKIRLNEKKNNNV